MSRWGQVAPLGLSAPNGSRLPEEDHEDHRRWQRFRRSRNWQGDGQARQPVTFLDVDHDLVATLATRAPTPAAATTIGHGGRHDVLCPDAAGPKFRPDSFAQAVEEFAWRLRGHNKYHVAVVRSTVPPKTTREFVLPLIEEVSGKKAGRDFGVVMQPEYLREVTAEQDFARPWFITDRRVRREVRRRRRARSTATSTRRSPASSLEEAEFQKYVHNVYNAVKIAFFNEMRVVANARAGMPRPSSRRRRESCEGIWNPMYGLRNFGPFDGSCLPKDTSALLEWGDMNGYQMEILRSVISENLDATQACSAATRRYATTSWKPCPCLGTALHPPSLRSARIIGLWRWSFWLVRRIGAAAYRPKVGCGPRVRSS